MVQGPNRPRDSRERDETLPRLPGNRRHKETYVPEVVDHRGYRVRSNLLPPEQVPLRELTYLRRGVRLAGGNPNTEGGNPLLVEGPKPIVPNEDVIPQENVPRLGSFDTKVLAAPKHHKVVGQCKRPPRGIKPHRVAHGIINRGPVR